jgi:hypothetical protein
MSKVANAFFSRRSLQRIAGGGWKNLLPGSDSESSSPP